MCVRAAAPGVPRGDRGHDPGTVLTGWRGGAVSTHRQLVLHARQRARRREAPDHVREEEGVVGHRVPIEVPAPRRRAGAAVAGHGVDAQSWQSHMWAARSTTGSSMGLPRETGPCCLPGTQRSAGLGRRPLGPRCQGSLPTPSTRPLGLQAGSGTSGQGPRHVCGVRLAAPGPRRRCGCKGSRDKRGLVSEGARARARAEVLREPSLIHGHRTPGFQTRLPGKPLPLLCASVSLLQARMRSTM